MTTQRIWQEPLEIKLGDDLVPCVPQENSAIQVIVDVSGNNSVVNVMSPETNELINIELPVCVIEDIQTIIVEFRKRKLVLAKLISLVYWDGERWCQRINYEYEKIV